MLGTEDFEIVTLQEPHIDFLKLTRANPHWTIVYPDRHHDRTDATRLVMLVCCKQDFANSFITCTTDPGRRPPTTDHIPILSTIDLCPVLASRTPHYNYRETDWPTFKTDLKAALKGIPRPEEFTAVRDFNVAFDKLMSTIDSVIEKHVPIARTSPHTKRWWSKELSQTRAASHRLANKSYARKTNKWDPIHEEYRRAQNDYTEMIRKRNRSIGRRG